MEGSSSELLHVTGGRPALAVNHADVVLFAAREGGHGHLKGDGDRVLAAHNAAAGVGAFGDDALRKPQLRPDCR